MTKKCIERQTRARIERIERAGVRIDFDYSAKGLDVRAKVAQRTRMQQRLKRRLRALLTPAR